MATKTMREVLVRSSFGCLAFGAAALNSYGLLCLAQVIPTHNPATGWALFALLGFVSVVVGVVKYRAVLQDRDFDGSQWKTFVCPYCNGELALSRIPAAPKQSYPCPLCKETINGHTA